MDIEGGRSMSWRTLLLLIRAGLMFVPAVAGKKKPYPTAVMA
jgi:hypothetical protein